MKLTYEELLAKQTCNAKTRPGTPCKRRDLWWNGRCRLHGGLSTGPKSPEGKARSALNGNRPKIKERTSRMAERRAAFFATALQRD